MAIPLCTWTMCRATVTAVLVTLLQACGGGSGGDIGKDASPVVSANPIVLSGTVIYDSPLKLANVVVHDAQGHG